jgi:acyl dehydratase
VEIDPQLFPHMEIDPQVTIDPQNMAIDPHRIAENGFHRTTVHHFYQTYHFM